MSTRQVLYRRHLQAFRLCPCRRMREKDDATKNRKLATCKNFCCSVSTLVVRAKNFCCVHDRPDSNWVAKHCILYFSASQALHKLCPLADDLSKRKKNMKLSASSIVIVSFIGCGSVSAFSVPDHATARRSLSFRNSNSHLSQSQFKSQSQCTSSSLRTSMSTMNFLEEDKDHGISSSTSTVSNNNRFKEPLSASSSTMTVTPLPSSTKNREVDWDWEAVAANVFSEEDQRPIVLFDGLCNLCDASVNFFIDHDSDAKLRFSSLHSKVAQSLLLQAGKKPTDINKMVLVTKEKTYFSSEAVSRICQQLDPVPLRFIGHVGRFTPSFLRESIYKLVSANRHRFGENDSCRIDFDGTLTSRFVSDPVDIAEV